ncbi:MucB/RseB C-terminal domain-containing protein [Rheinheimera sp.]|jgi:negative regulator of sigma E activity|uniref:MucB/RseB C-terminal domain-containing protein n=1 Tax=Rheinheimera sp. TaxID=1869214 RepID=UPI00260EFBEA|nr:MucB/RseB C-terminal domain-containing protein [Rheinheimera sp.]MCA1931243.1 MucB/RseB C-terminal domain-containing protein [Rheinheimera sp.]
MGWKGLSSALIILFYSNLSFAEVSGWEWFERSQSSVRQYNFEASFVVIKPNQVDSYRWLHGVQDHSEIEQLMPLEQSGVEILRRDQMVYYIAPEKTPLATNSSTIKELPALLYRDIESIKTLYDAVPGGSAQLSGRPAQLLRLTPLQNDRPGYWMWLDSQTGFPLKIDTLTIQNEVLERWVVTHILPHTTLPEALSVAANADLPKAAEKLPTVSLPESPLELSWLPGGYQQVPVAAAMVPQQVLEQWLLSDGLHQVSVFVQPGASLPAQAFRDGATTIFVMPKNQFDVTVIGPVSIESARQIAESVR